MRYDINKSTFINELDELATSLAQSGIEDCPFHLGGLRVVAETFLQKLEQIRDSHKAGNPATMCCNFGQNE